MTDRSAAATGAQAMRPATSPDVILTVQCPDTTGIVAAVTGFVAANHGLITQAQHYDDPYSDTSFLRVVFRDNGGGLVGIDELDRHFRAEVGERFSMSWRFHDARRPCRVILAVSTQAHCLNSFLHRWSTGTLPVEVLAVVSNHEDLRRIAEWHGVPYHHMPLVDGGKPAQEKRIIELFERSNVAGARALHADPE